MSEYSRALYFSHFSCPALLLSYTSPAFSTGGIQETNLDYRFFGTDAFSLLRR